MKNTRRRFSRQHSLRGICMAAAALLFVISVAALMLRPGSDTALWRGLALSALYLALCLTQRRLFAPRGIAHRRFTLP